jgi:hypothetical protein
MSYRKVFPLAIALAVVVAVVVAPACRKPAKVILTKDQQVRIGENVLKDAPTPKYKSAANFGDNIRLVGIDVAPDQVRAGQEMTITYYWECLRPTTGDWKVFGHLELPGGKRMILDHVPVAELYPVNQWKQGEIIRDIQKITVDPESKAGQALLWAGLFSEEIYRERGSGDRMPLVNKEQVPNDGENRVRVASFAVLGKDGPARGPSVIKALRTHAAPVIDGRADEPDWGFATFAVLNDAAGRPVDAKAQTKVRTLWDDTNLYIAFESLDDSVESLFSKRDDELWTRDAVEVYLDAGADGKDYLELQVSPANVIFDAKFDTRRQPEWQKAKEFTLEGLRTAVSVNGTLNQQGDQDTGYDVEIAIPWASIPGWTKAAPGVGDEIRVNFFRIEARDAKVTGAQAFAPAGGDFHDLDKAGTLRLLPTSEEVVRLATPPVAPAVAAPAPAASAEAGVVKPVQMPAGAGMRKAMSQPRGMAPANLKGAPASGLSRPGSR